MPRPRRSRPAWSTSPATRRRSPPAPSWSPTGATPCTDPRRLQAVGDGSAGLLSLRPGTRALVEGPYGRLSARARTRDKVALIGAGVGITPLRALAEGLDYAPGDAVILQRHTSEPLFASELTRVREGAPGAAAPGTSPQP